MSAESIKRLLENQVVKVAWETIQTTADAIEERLEVNTPKQTGKTATSWTQEKQENGDIHIVTRLKTKKGFQPACYFLELNYGNANQPPTMFIEKSIAEGLQDAMGPSKKIG